MATKKQPSKATEGAPSLIKLVVTHRAALKSKYGAGGYAKIRRALDAMAKADRKRGISLTLVLLDAPKTADIPMAANATAARQCKRAIDALYAKHGRPDYVLILGGPDVVAHQRLRNPCAGQLDEESMVPSDLPYACDQGYSLDAKQFLGATRVVGRLPDIPGSRDVRYLVDRIMHASRARTSRARSYFALSAEIWKGASQENFKRSFAAKPAELYCSPAHGPAWTKPLLHRSLHLINCHGNPSFDGFSGQPRSGEEDYPLALDSAAIKGRIRNNAVVAAECCYGAELYEPSAPLPKGMALTYLEEGAMGFLGSSTIAYGALQAADVNCADVLCADFLSQVVAGATTGRALLEARQKFVQGGAVLDIYELKTLAQFMLLGDPSYRAFAPKAAASSARSIRGHTAQRQMLARKGGELHRSVIAATKQVAASAGMARTLAGRLDLPPGFADGQVMRFEVETPRPSRLALAKRPGRSAGESILVVVKTGYAGLPGFADAAPRPAAIASTSRPRSKHGRSETAAAALRRPARRVRDRIALVARMRNGRVVSQRIVATR